MKIQTERLILRNFILSDAKECYENFGQDASLGRYIAGYPMSSITEMESMVEAFTQNENIWLVEDKLTHSPMGYVSMDLQYDILGIGEIGFLLGEKFWKKGYAKEASSKVMEYYFKEKQMYMIEAKVNEKNIASKNLLKALGFMEDAVLKNRRIDLITGERCNLVIYSIMNE